MSSKSSGLLNRIKSKSIDKLFNQSSSQITTSYQYIDNFENVSEEDCIKLDNTNREIYKKNMELYDIINKKIENKNAMFKIETPPQSPPEPNNHEKFINYKMRNVSYNVRYQTLAVCYLLSKGYKLHFNKQENKNDNDFEPFEAIELFQKLENISIEQAFKNKNYEFYTNLNMGINIRNNIPPSYYKDSNTDTQYPQLSSSAPNIYYNAIPSAPPGPELNKYITGPPAMHYINKI
jgi:hypothetical protein